MVQLEVRQVGKASDFDSDMHRFESCTSCQKEYWLSSIVGLMRYPVTVEIVGSNPI